MKGKTLQARTMGLWKYLAAGVLAAGVLMGTALWSADGDARSMRAPTAEEKAMLVRYRDTLHSILDQIPNQDWAEHENGRFDVDDDAEVSNDPDVPLDINESMTREYRVRPGSNFEQEQVARLEPLMEKFKAAPTDPAVQAEIQKAAKPMTLKVNVHFNHLSEGLDAPPASLVDLRLPGTAMAFRSKPDQYGEVSVQLLFGNWKTATWDNYGHWLRFHFKRPGRYPAIENIVIDMTGSPERIDELLKTVDWKVVNRGLTTQ
jgi:hypothetical protein